MPISSKAWPLTLIKRLIISIVSKNHSLQYSCTVEVLPRLALNSTTTAWQMTHSLQNCPELNKSKQLEKGCSVVDSLLWQVKNDPIYASNPIILIFQSHQYTIHRDFSSCGPNRSFWSFLWLQSNGVKRSFCGDFGVPWFNDVRVFQFDCFPQGLVVSSLSIQHFAYVCQKVCLFFAQTP